MQIERITSPFGIEQKTTLNTIIGWLSGESNSTNVGVQTLWQEQSVFHQCVSLRASAIQNMPWSIYAGSSDPVWTSEDGSVPKNLQWISTLPTLLYQWEASLCTVGAAYTLKGRRRGTPGLDLQYFNPLKVEPLADAARAIYAYKRTVERGQEIHRAEDVFALFVPDPFRELGPGASSAQAAMRNARVLRAIEGFLQGHMDNGLLKRTILTVDSEGRPQPEELERLESWWNKFLSGWKGSEAKVMSKAVKPHVIGEGLGDINNRELTEDQRMGIAAGFGIPYSLISSSAANYATKKGDQVDFYSLTAIPRALMIQREMNRQLFSEFGFEFLFEPDKIEAMQATELEKAQAIYAVVGKPLLTVNEGRALLGYDPLEGMDAVDTMDPAQDQQQQAGNDQQVTQEQKAELAAWRRRVKNKGRDTRFNPEHLTTKQAALIRQRLQTGEPLETVFNPPFVGF